jgi:N-acetylneuraminic acid mutarotase
LIGLGACCEPKPDPPEPAWQQLADMPSRRLEAAAAGLGARFIVLGGFATSDREVPPLEITREILEYDPFGRTWTSLPIEAPEAWTHANLAGFGGSLYLLGGLEGTNFVASGKAFRLLPSRVTWDMLAPMPPGLERGAAAVVISRGHIFLFGGATSTGETASVLDYVIAEDRWQELPPLPTPRSHAAAMRTDDDGTFIVAGGIGPQGPLGDVWSLSVGDTMWRPRNPMPTPRGGCAYGELYGFLICAGGETATGPTDIVEVYDPNPAIDEWTTKPEMPEPRAGAPGAIVTSRLLVAGGSATTAFEPTSTLFEFDLLDTLPR